MGDMTAVAAEAAWLLLAGLAVVGSMVALANGRLRWYPTNFLHWFMIIGLAQGPYGLLLASGLIPQAKAPAVGMVMLPMWIIGIGGAVWAGKRAVLGAWADRQVARILGDLHVLARVTALHRRADGGEVRDSFVREARTALQRRRGRRALVSLDKVLDEMEPHLAANDEWSELRSRVGTLKANFVRRPSTSRTSAAA
ncbi:hypothetical protein ACFVW1_44010 [Streptomyces olivochromogenes]|uniref:hypothetical protein n=1 Tax=Streptomyces olivochromogenes TaxID=1963 RepID=UPI0036DA7FE6